MEMDKRMSSVSKRKTIHNLMGKGDQLITVQVIKIWRYNQNGICKKPAPVQENESQKMFLDFVVGFGLVWF